MKLAPLHRAWLLAAIPLALACPADDTVPSDDGDAGGTSTSTAPTSTASTNGATSTPGITSTSSPGATGGSSDSTAADSTGTEPPLDACTCALTYPARLSCSPEELVDWVQGCPQEQPCTRLSVTCPRPGHDLYDCKSELVFDEGATQCMLETLRDGTPARLEIDGLEDGLFSGQELFMVHVLEGRVAVRASCMFGDAGVILDGPTTHALADADYFTACMGEATPRQRYYCLMDGLLGEGTLLPACPG